MTSPESKSQNSGHSLAHDSVGTTLTNVALFIVGILIWIAIARILGPIWRGALALVMIAPTIVIKGGTFGFDQGMIVLGGGDRNKLGPLTRTGIVFGLIFGLIAVGILMGFMWGFPKTFWRICQEVWMPLPFLLISLAFPLHLMTLVYDAAIYAEDRISARNLKELVINVLMLLILAALVFFWHKRLIGVILAYVLANIISLLYAMLLVRGHVNLSGRPDMKLASQAVKLGFPVYLAQLAAYIMLPAMMVVLSFSLTGKAGDNLARIAYFTMAYQMIERTLPVTRSVAFALLPKITDGSDAEAGRLAARASRHTLIAAAGIFILLVLFMHPIVSILLGQQYISIVGAFAIMAPGGIALSLIGVWSAHLLARHRPMPVAWGGILGVITALVISWLGFNYLPEGREVMAASIAVVSGTLVNALYLLPTFCKIGKIPLREALVPGIDDFRDWKRIPGLVKRVIMRKRHRTEDGA